MIPTIYSLPPLHDGLLLGMIVKNQEARIFIQTESGSPFTLVLSGVRRFHAEGFAEGNTILDCGVSGSPDIPSEFLKQLNHGGTREIELAQLRDMVADGKYQFFSIVPSYGATIVALMEDLVVKPGVVLR
jgi:hypothetical protein